MINTHTDLKSPQDKTDKEAIIAVSVQGHAQDRCTPGGERKGATGGTDNGLGRKRGVREPAGSGAS